MRVVSSSHSFPIVSMAKVILPKPRYRIAVRLLLPSKRSGKSEMTTRRALITGITGQDGAYLTELLLGKGYEVHGVLRRASSFNTERLDHIYHDPHVAGPGLRLHYGDLSDGTALRRVLEKVQPQEVYNLPAQSHVKGSFEIPEYTGDIVPMRPLPRPQALPDHMETTRPTVPHYQ